LTELAPPVAENPAIGADPAPSREDSKRTAKTNVEEAGAPSPRPVWLGIVFGTIGGVGLAGGAALEIAAAVIRSDIAEQTCPSGADSCAEEVVASNDRNNRLTAGGIAALSVGALATGAMIGYLLWPDDSTRSSEVAIVPWVAPGMAGASLGLRW
jgi:hypothetical protein